MHYGYNDSNSQRQGEQDGKKQTGGQWWVETNTQRQRGREKHQPNYLQLFYVLHLATWALSWLAMPEWVQRCCIELFHSSSPDQMNGSVTHTTGSLAHTLFEAIVYSRSWVRKGVNKRPPVYSWFCSVCGMKRAVVGFHFFYEFYGPFHHNGFQDRTPTYLLPSFPKTIVNSNRFHHRSRLTMTLSYLLSALSQISLDSMR